jgi:hypothetical protein
METPPANAHRNCNPCYDFVQFHRNDLPGKFAQLAPEIAQDIIELTVTPDNDERENKTLKQAYTLMLVCRSFRHPVIRSTNELFLEWTPSRNLEDLIQTMQKFYHTKKVTISSAVYRTSNYRYKWQWFSPRQITDLLKNIPAHLHSFTLDSSYLDMESLTELMRLKAIQSLSLINCRTLSSDNIFRPIEQLQQLRSLRLSGWDLFDKVAIQVANLNQLTSLDLSESKHLSITALKHIAKLPRLKYLSLHRITEPAPEGPEGAYTGSSVIPQDQIKLLATAFHKARQELGLPPVEIAT